MTPFAAPVPRRTRKHADALALSHEHHQALKEAIELKRARAEPAQSIWRRFVRFWERESNAHFIEEEPELAYARVADPNHRAVVTMLLEHVLIRARVAAIREQPEPLAANLYKLGSWLELHATRSSCAFIEDATGMGHFKRPRWGNCKRPLRRASVRRRRLTIV